MNNKENTFEALRKCIRSNNDLFSMYSKENDVATAVTGYRIEDILQSISVERSRQEMKWGVQELVDRIEGVMNESPNHWLDVAVNYKNEDRKNPEGISWQSVLMEEVAEAFAETEPTEIIGELIQVAAVCVAWIENLSSRNMGTK